MSTRLRHPITAHAADWAGTRHRGLDLEPAPRQARPQAAPTVGDILATRHQPESSAIIERQDRCFAAYLWQLKQAGQLHGEVPARYTRFWFSVYDGTPPRLDAAAQSSLRERLTADVVADWAAQQQDVATAPVRPRRSTDQPAWPTMSAQLQHILVGSWEPGMVMGVAGFDLLLESKGVTGVSARLQAKVEAQTLGVLVG
jgi:hypothetical protein